MGLMEIYWFPYKKIDANFFYKNYVYFLSQNKYNIFNLLS